MNSPCTTTLDPKPLVPLKYWTSPQNCPQNGPQKGIIFLGRDPASRVTSAPRGLGLYRRAGREGFFFIKNLAAQAKRHPGQIKRSYIDEQIRSATGDLVTSQKAAEAYCHRRKAEIDEMLLSLNGEFISYSGTDLEGIAQTLADKWIRGHQRGLNLQDLNIWIGWLHWLDMPPQRRGMGHLIGRKWVLGWECTRLMKRANSVQPVIPT